MDKITKAPRFSRDSGIIKVPVSHRILAMSLARKLLGNEFSWLSKIEKVKDGVIYISEEYYIPKQEVTPASVDFKEALPREYNVIFHKHPRGLTSFSVSDLETISVNFEVSILYADGEWCDSTISKYVPGFGFLVVNGVEVEDLLPEYDSSKIIIKKPTYLGANNIKGNIYGTWKGKSARSPLTADEEDEDFLY